ncbi:MAG: NYN domain-containing protein, partial [Pseudomonadota bacterium]
MDRQRIRPVLSAVFIDYDNIYLSLKRKSASAARQFARAPGVWLRDIEHGALVSMRSGDEDVERRIVLNRSYGNPSTRRANDDKNAFPHVRHHFVRAGCEIVDCPPLTAQLKNSSDIRMVMDIRDLLHHETHFDEFIILSGDSDFTPVLHRLRAHARRTIVYVNDHTAMPYTAIADGEIREDDLVALLEASLVEDEQELRSPAEAGQHALTVEDADRRQRDQDAILAEVIGMIRAAPEPVPLETLADRAQRVLGRENTSDRNWAGFGNFRAFLTACLPIEYRLTNEAPFIAYEVERMDGPLAPPPAPASPDAQPKDKSAVAPAPATTIPVKDAATADPFQQMIGRILEACQAPPLSPPQYATLFEIIAAEIAENALNGGQTLANIGARAAARRVTIAPNDIRFVLDVISEPDPWFAQGVGADIFAMRFRDFVVTRCRSQGMELMGDDLRLIDKWFAADAVSSVRSEPAPDPTARDANPWNEAPQ